MPPARSILTQTEAMALRSRLDQKGKRLVFTNGCFDLLHAGHIRCLAEARKLGDALLVGLNSDASVSELKGPSRPVNTAADRAALLLAMPVVDGVVVFDGMRATGLLQAVKPHLYAKGGDYTLESLHPEERTVLESCGSRICLLSKFSGPSTTGILARDGTRLRPPARANETTGRALPVIIESISQIEDARDAVILDQWGVIHDGHALLPGVESFLLKMRERNVPVIIITNSGRPATYNRERLERRFGLAQSLYRTLFSSFDILCRKLRAAAAFPVLAIAGDGEERFLSDAGIPLTDDIRSAAGIALISACPGHTADSFRELLETAVRRRLPVFCAARDAMRVMPGTPAPGPGVLADLMEAQQITVSNAGKPEPDLYRECLRELPGIAASRMLAIGDQFETDVRGANQAGMASALVLTGTIQALSGSLVRALAQCDTPQWISAGLGG